jgi:hypothetical protein
MVVNDGRGWLCFLLMKKERERQLLSKLEFYVGCWRVERSEFPFRLGRIGDDEELKS